MSGILVDTNVLLDVMTDDPSWADWSAAQLRSWNVRGPLFINAVIYAEISIGYARIEQLDAELAESEIIVADIPRSALFLAGKVYSRYRRAGGLRTGVLPDFFIGAHAATIKLPLLTRDVRRYRNYFSGLELITPHKQEESGRRM
jgi:predicted nucleic acid-binding protein